MDDSLTKYSISGRKFLNTTVGDSKMFLNGILPSTAIRFGIGKYTSSPTAAKQADGIFFLYMIISNVLSSKTKTSNAI
jgi:hypothetical protein